MNKNLKIIFSALLLSFFLEYLLFFFIFEGNDNYKHRIDFVFCWVASLFVIIPMAFLIEEYEK